MKVFAIASIAKPISDEQRKEILPREVPATLKHYLDGKIEQFWSRQDAPGVIFLMNVESVEQAKAELDTLPLVAADLMTYELIGRPARAVGPVDPGQVSAGGAVP